MTHSARLLLDQALGLSDEDRVGLATALLGSLDAVSEAEAEAAWRQEVRARVEAVDAGGLETVPWETVADRLRTRLGAPR